MITAHRRVDAAAPPRYRAGMRCWILAPLLVACACGPGSALGNTSSTSTGPAATTAASDPPDTSHGETTAAPTTALASTSASPHPSTSGPATPTTTTEPAPPDTTSTTSADTTTTTTTSDGGSSNSTGGIDFECLTGGDAPGPAVPDPCACINDQQPGPTQPMLPTCGEEICDMLLGEWNGPLEFTNPDALECALAALRDRKPGLLRYDLDVEGNYAENSGYILILADGTAIVRRWGHEDLTFWVGHGVHVELPDPCAFAQCLVDPDDWTRFKCLDDFPYTQLTVCDEGWGGDY